MATLSALFLSSLLFRAVSSASVPINRKDWTVTASSFQAGNEPESALDNRADTFWHSQYEPLPDDAMPNWLIVDMKQTYSVHGVEYTPRQDGNANGRIGAHRIEVSTDGNNWANPVAQGTYINDAITKKTSFLPIQAQYVRFTALSEAQGTGAKWSAIAELNVYHEVNYAARDGWTASADSQEMADQQDPATNALDGKTGSFWHSAYSGDNPAPLPHWFQIDAGAEVTVSGLSVLPRVDQANGRIGDYKVETSNDGNDWAEVASGTWADDASEKFASFDATARYFRLNALTEAGNRGPWSSAVEFNLVGTNEAPFNAPAAEQGLWVNTIDFPLVPAAAAMLPNGKVLLWSSFARDQFGGENGYTQTAIYDPATGDSTQRTVQETQHDMFCPGISIDHNGRIVVSGGSNAARTSIYDAENDSWTAGPDMKVARGYQSTATCSDGRIFNIGGSWSGGEGNKNGEIFDPNANSWSLIQNALVSPMLTQDRRGVYRQDNHGWLFGWKDSTVFQAGPSKAMNWYDTVGDGSVTGAGNRDDDGDSMNGNAVMFDAAAGKILTAGGAANYQTDEARTNAYVITLGDPKTNPEVVKVANMANARGFANGVVLPDGTVFVTGGQSTVEPFTDTTAQYTPELFNPATNTWTQLNPMAIPRTYHSVALLLPDATIFNAGGGLCGACYTNHFDGEIFVPPYLLNGDGSRKERPEITNVADTIQLGGTLDITTNGPVTAFSLIRTGSATHTVDTDQRRIPLTPEGDGTDYKVTIPDNAGVALPGFWFLFAINGEGVPSVAKIIKVTT